MDPLEARLARLERQLALAKKTIGLTVWQFAFDGPSIANARLIANEVLAAMSFVDAMAADGVPVEFRDSVLAEIQTRVDAGANEVEVEYPLVMPDGSWSWRLTRGAVLRDDAGAPTAFEGVALDITARKQSEERERKLLEQERKLTESVQVALSNSETSRSEIGKEAKRYKERLDLAILGSKACTWDLELGDGTLAGARATFTNVFELLGYHPTEAAPFPDSLGIFIASDEQPTLRADVQRELDGTANEWERAYPVRHRDGSLRTHLSRGIIKRDAAGRAMRFTGISIDITERQESEQRFRATFENAAVGFTITDPRGVFQDCNETLCKLVGYSREELVGQHGPSLLFPDDPDRTRERLRALNAGELPHYSLDRHYRRRDGTVAWLNLTFSVMSRDASGSPDRILGVFHDITERLRAETELRASEQKFRAMYENAGLGFSITSDEGLFLDCNDMLCNVLNLTRAELIGRDAPTVLVPDEVPGAMESIRQLVNGQVQQQSFDRRYVRNDGSEVWLNMTFSIISREPIRLLGVYQDITSRKQLQEDLQRTKERLELGIRGSGTTVFDLSNASDGAPNTLTLVGWENFGYDATTSLTDPDEIGTLLHHPDDHEHADATTRAYLSGASAKLETEYRIRHADGSYSWRLVRGEALRDTSGRPTRLLGSMVDITEIKRITTELQRARQTAELANRAKDEFLANVSHEIRTPMNAILGMTELALDASETPRQKQLLSTVSVAARNLLSVINDLLDFSKITAGKFALDHADFSLRAALSDTLRALAVRAHRKGLELVCDVHRDVPDLYFGDVGRLGQVLMNLVGNAIKFTSGGEVVVRVAIDPDARGGDAVPLRFSVRDTGVGIAEEKHASIFRAFEQEDASTTRRFGGTGLGLTISSQLAALMEGRITVDSAPGRGSTFTFTARLARSSKAELESVSIARPPKNLDVLVVDDNATHRGLLTDWLEGWRIRATAVADAASALDELSRARQSGRPFAIVLLDGSMPDADSIAVATQIRERFGSELRVVLLSSDHSPNHAARFRDAGVRAHLLKPIQQSELLETIWAVMSSPTSAVASDAVPHPKTAARHARSLYILVAEDNELNVMLLRELLGQHGHSVEVVGDGRSAYTLASAPSAAYDLMLLDLHMPEMDGFEVVQAVRERERETGKHLAIIALTARSSARDRERALAAGMDDFLSKPIGVTELWATIDRVTAHDVRSDKRRPSTLLDARVVVQSCSGRSAVLDRLCEVFRRAVPEQLAVLRPALERRDFRRLRAAAHMLAGTLAAFSTSACTLATTLEDAANGEDAEACVALLAELEVMCATLIEDTRGLTLDALEKA